MSVRNIRNGFSQESVAKIRAAIDAKQKEALTKKPGIPDAILRTIDAMVGGASMGQIGQLELAVMHPLHGVRRIRLVALPQDFGQVEVTEDGKKIRVLLLPDDLGQVKEIPCAGNPETESKT